MNVGVFWAAFSAIALGVVTNELCDISPWLARRILRIAARLEDRDKSNASLVFEELAAMLEGIPGKLTKLCWAIGRLGFASYLAIGRARREIPNKERFIAGLVYGLIAGAVSGLLFGALGVFVLLMPVALGVFAEFADTRWNLDDAIGTFIVRQYRRVVPKRVR